MVVCDFCNQNFMYDSLLVRHLSRKNPCFWNTCIIDTKTSHDTIHDKNVIPADNTVITNNIEDTGTNMKIYQCERCDKVLSTNYNL